MNALRTLLVNAIIATIICCSNHAYGQKPEVLIDSGIQRVYSADTMIIFGLDFSAFKIVNKDKLNHGHLIKEKYIRGWTSNFEYNFPKNKFEKNFKANTLVYKVYEFHGKQYLKIDEKNIVISESSLLTVGDISLIVKDYKHELESGIGFSIVVEEFHKRKENVTLLFVFFDVSSNKPLYVFRDFGSAGGIGMTNHWYTGVQKIVDNYLNFRYKKEYKKNKTK